MARVTQERSELRLDALLKVMFVSRLSVLWNHLQCYTLPLLGTYIDYFIHYYYYFTN